MMSFGSQVGKKKRPTKKIRPTKRKKYTKRRPTKKNKTYKKKKILGKKHIGGGGPFALFQNMLGLKKSGAKTLEESDEVSSEDSDEEKAEAIYNNNMKMLDGLGDGESRKINGITFKKYNFYSENKLSGYNDSGKRVFYKEITTTNRR